MKFFFETRFWPMWTAQCVGAITDNGLKQGLIIGLTFGVLTPPFGTAETLLPLLGALFGIGMMVFSPIGGQLADKFETTLMFRRTKLLELGIMCLAALGFIFREPITLSLALFLMAMQSALFNPARVSAMPKYLSTNELLAGNALCSAGLYASILLGYSIGGFLITKPGGIYTIATVLVIGSLIGWRATYFCPERKADDPSLQLDFNWFRQTAKLVSYVNEERAVLWPMIGVFTFYLIVTAITVLLPLYVRDTLAASGDLSTLIMGIFTVGTLIGALSIAFISKGRSALGVSAFAIIAAGITSISIYFLSASELAVIAPGCRDGSIIEQCRSVSAFLAGPRQYALLIVLFLSAIFFGAYIVPMQTAIQRRVRPLRRAQIISAGNIINAMGAVLGSFLVYVVTLTDITTNQAFLGAAFGQLMIAAVMFYRRSTVPDGKYDEMLKS